MNNKKETTGEKIKRFRIERNLTQRQLAEKCKMYESQIRKYESGKANPKIQTLGKIASAMELPVDALRSDSDLALEKLTEDLKSLFEGSTIKIVGEMIDNDNELFIVQNYRKLNNAGKEEAQKRISELTELRKYTETEEK